MTISTQRLRFLRGNSSAVAAFTGLQGELVFNTDTYTLHLQDGVTAGGYSLATSAELANIGGSSYGNSNVSSYLTSNSNVVIITTGNITTNGNITGQRLDTNILALGSVANFSQHPLIVSDVNDVVSFFTGNRANGNASIKLQANNSLSGIYLRNDNGSMGFNTIPSGPNVGFTFDFNGSLYATEFYTDANTPTGYQFTTVGDTGISHVDYGAVSAIRIKHDGVETVKFYDNNTTEMRGNIVVTDGVHYGQYPDAYLQIYGFANSYQQLVMQNLNSNSAASSDIVATADNGSDTTYYINMGINSSTFAADNWFPGSSTVNDGYLYVAGYDIAGPSTADIGNLVIGSTNGVVKTFVGNTSDANVVTTVSTNLLTVNGGLSVSGNITGNTSGFAIGYRDIPQVIFTSNTTLALTDAGKHYYSANSVNTITVPNNATISFNIGTAISIVQQGTANLTISPAAGVTMYLAGNSTSASRTLGNYGMATLMKVATDTWFIDGTGLT